MDALSWMRSLYVPAFRVFTAFPPCFRLIEKPGPTVPVSVGVAERPPNAVATSRAPAAVATVKTSNIRFIGFLPRSLPTDTGGEPQRFAALAADENLTTVDRERVLVRGVSRAVVERRLDSP